MKNERKVVRCLGCPFFQTTRQDFNRSPIQLVMSKSKSSCIRLTVASPRAPSTEAESADPCDRCPGEKSCLHLLDGRYAVGSSASQQLPFSTCMRYPLSLLHRPLQCRSLSYTRFRPLKYSMSVRPLDFYAGPLVWIDCEMTGLNPRKNKILEIAVRNPLASLAYVLLVTSAQVLIGSHHKRKSRTC